MMPHHGSDYNPMTLLLSANEENYRTLNPEELLLSNILGLNSVFEAFRYIHKYIHAG
jgi:hypothetical protein